MPEATAAVVPPPPSLDELGATIRAELARRGLRQRDLAAALRLSQQQTSARLAGRVPFTVDQLYATASLLGVPAAELLP